jgi:hypothetical protein
MEDLAQVAHEGQHRVEVTDAAWSTRRAHVESLRGQPLLEIRTLEGLQTAPDGTLDLAAHLVRKLAE